MKNEDGADIRALLEEVRAMRGEHKELMALRERVGQLEDRNEIYETVARYCRAIDRHDWTLLYDEVYHPDGVGISDSVGMNGDARAWVQRLEPRYIERYSAHFHVIANHMCDLRGDVAYTETYCITYGVMKTGDELQCMHLRYIDKLERRDGKWKIAVRRIVGDARTRLATIEKPNVESRWDRTDWAYDRS